MSIDEEAIRHIARLARIRVDDDAVPPLVHDMSRILDFIAQLDVLDTAHVMPMTGVIDMALPMRDDTVNDGGYPEIILAHAPARDVARDDDYFAVAKVVE